MSSEPREFWINSNPDNRGWSEGKPDQSLIDANPYEAIHVIEKSAYDKLKEDNEMLRKEIKALNEQLNCDGYY